MFSWGWATMINANREKTIVQRNDYDWLNHDSSVTCSSLAPCSLVVHQMWKSTQLFTGTLTYPSEISTAFDIIQHAYSEFTIDFDRPCFLQTTSRWYRELFACDVPFLYVDMQMNIGNIWWDLTHHRTVRNFEALLEQRLQKNDWRCVRSVDKPVLQILDVFGICSGTKQRIQRWSVQYWVEHSATWGTCRWGAMLSGIILPVSMQWIVSRKDGFVRWYGLTEKKRFGIFAWTICSSTFP